MGMPFKVPNQPKQIFIWYGNILINLRRYLNWSSYPMSLCWKLSSPVLNGVDIDDESFKHNWIAASVTGKGTHKGPLVTSQNQLSRLRMCCDMCRPLQQNTSDVIKTIADDFQDLEPKKKWKLDGKRLLRKRIFILAHLFVSQKKVNHNQLPHRQYKRHRREMPENNSRESEQRRVGMRENVVYTENCWFPNFLYII